MLVHNYGVCLINCQSQTVSTFTLDNFTHLWVVISAANHEICHTVLRKSIVLTVSAAVYIGTGTSFLGYQCIEITSSKIKASAFKITKAKTKDDGAI